MDLERDRLALGCARARSRLRPGRARDRRGARRQDRLDLVERGRVARRPSRAAEVERRATLVVAKVGVGAVREQSPALAGRPLVAAVRSGCPPQTGSTPSTGTPSATSRSMTSRRWWSVAMTSARIRASGAAPSSQPVTSPAAAATSMLSMRAPAATRTSTTSVMPNTAAWSRAFPPGTPPESGDAVASMSAPASIRARATPASP